MSMSVSSSQSCMIALMISGFRSMSYTSSPILVNVGPSKVSLWLFQKVLTALAVSSCDSA